MREIKFRGWHVRQHKMFSAEEMTADQMTILPTGQFINVAPTLTGSRIYPLDRFLPLQFTGLLDKNGKEIYEGDIVKTSTGNCAVIWDGKDGMWGFGDRHPLFFADINQREVIGKYLMQEVMRRKEIESIVSIE